MTLAVADGLEAGPARGERRGRGGWNADSLLSRVVKAFALTFGVAILCLLVEISPLTSGMHMAAYHFDGSASDLFLPVLVNIGGLWAILAGLILLEKSGRLRASIWTGIMLMLPWVGFKEGLMVTGSHLPHWASLGLMATPFTGLIGVNVFWRPSLEARLARLRSLCEAILFALSLSGVLILAQLFYFLVQARGLNDPPRLHAAAPAGARAAGEPKRLIVILFDELSYEQTYGNRSPRVSLPAFDRLAAESMVFGNVRPAAEFTDRAIPSMLSGQTANEIRSSGDGRTLEMQSAKGWTRFDPEETLFGDALKEGYSTGLVGWYNPYCRILAAVLDSCEWRAHAILPNMLATDGPMAGCNLLDNSVEPLRGMLRLIPGFFHPALHSKRLDGDLADQRITERHAMDYSQISNAADALLSDASKTFLFLHLPVPHQGGIYDRSKGVASQHSTSYLDNLALADQYLGHARELLEQRGDWDDSMVMVLGDHSWRTWLWTDSLFWTEEDRAVSEGKEFDDRPAMVVKLPHEREPGRIDAAFEAKRTRWMLDELMTGRIKTEAGLARWVEEQAR